MGITKPMNTFYMGLGQQRSVN